MKKLLTLAAIAAFGTSLVHAADDGETDTDKEAQVYDIKVTAKTTAAKKGKLSLKKNKFIDESDTVVYRAQGSQSWTGVLWGCGCETLRGVWDTVGEGAEVVSGVAIWNNKKPNTIVFLDDMKWRVLNAIDAAGTKVEAAWTIGDSSDASNAFLAFAGFGALLANGAHEDCLYSVKSLAGNVAGWMPAPTMTTPGKPGVCTFCSGVIGTTPDEEDVAVAWSVCDCVDIGDPDFTAVSGTWSLKYNKTLSRKLSSASSILGVYTKFPETVKTAVAQKIGEVAGTAN